MDYKIIDSYIIGISFNSLAINTGDIDRSCLKSRVFISYNKTFDERYYEVAMTLDMGYKPVDKEEFSLSFCYVEVVDVDPAATPMQHREIILDKVTPRAYDKVRLHAATILEMSCYRSLILGDIDIGFHNAITGSIQQGLGTDIVQDTLTDILILLRQIETADYCQNQTEQTHGGSNGSS